MEAIPLLQIPKDWIDKVAIRSIGSDKAMISPPDFIFVSYLMVTHLISGAGEPEINGLSFKRGNLKQDFEAAKQQFINERNNSLWRSILLKISNPSNYHLAMKEFLDVEKGH